MPLLAAAVVLALAFPAEPQKTWDLAKCEQLLTEFKRQMGHFCTPEHLEADLAQLSAVDWKAVSARTGNPVVPSRSELRSDAEIGAIEDSIAFPQPDRSAPVGRTLDTSVVTIYVGPQTRAGFVVTDKGIQDSIKDIQGELRKTKVVRVVESEKAATMSLYVLGRGIGPPSGDGSAINIPIGATSMSFLVSAKARHVDTLLRIGGYKRAFVGDDHATGAWSECAEAIAKDIKVWLAANGESVLTRQQLLGRPE